MRDQDLVFSFKYEDSWLEDEEKFPLSIALKLEKKIYGNKETLAFFENLLPEGEAKESIEKSQDIKGVFDFLAKFGQDCAGAITISADPNYSAITTGSKLIEIDVEKIYQALDEKKSVVAVIAEENPGYLSIAGAQDKFPAVFKDNKFYLPQNGIPTTHIIKMPIYRSNVRDSVFNELFCMKLAKKIGFNTAECSVHIGKYPLYIVERYDRYQDAKGVTHRLHQQDFCQAQGVTSEFKYEEKGGPTIKNGYDLIINHIHPKERIKSINILLDWVSFNLLIGNNDSHSKNFSFLMKNGRNEIAPVYDLLCTAVYPKLRHHFAFKIGGRNNYTTIGKNEFNKLDADVAIRAGTSMERFQLVNDLIQSYKKDLVNEMKAEYPGNNIFDKIDELINDRSKSFKIQKALKDRKF